MEHDIECRYKHLRVNDGCDCEFIKYIRLQDQKDMSAALWPLIQPIVDWIAAVNMVELSSDNNRSTE